MKRVEWAWLALAVALGVFFRVYRLGDIPPGMTHDEADVGYHAAAVYETGQRHLVDQPYGFINQPFVQYSGALFMRLFGPTDLAQRLHSVFFGALVIVFTALWARRAFDAWIALTAAAFLAVGFWPVMTSRFALNNQPVPALFAAGVWLLWLAFPTAGRRAKGTAWGLAAGLCLGLSVYPYEAGRAALASLPALGVYLFIVRRRSRASTPPYSLKPFLLALAVALLVAAPHLLDPRSWGRTSTLVSETVGAGGAHSPIAALAEGLGTLFVKGDPFVTYNIPDRAILDPLLAVPFVAGLVIAARRWREPAYGYTLIWLVFGFAPTLVVGAFTSTIHSIAAQPPIFVLLAAGAVALARWIGRGRPGRAASLLVGWAILSAVIGGRDYFERWANEPAVRAAYYSYFASMIEEVNMRSGVQHVAISSAYPDKPLDPFIAARRLRRSDAALRHFDARRAIVLPDADSALLLVPALTPIDPALVDRLDLPQPEIVAMRPDDRVASFAAYDMNPRVISDRLIADLAPLSANFGDAVELVAAQVVTRRVAPGGEVVVVSVWRVLDAEALGPVDPTKYDRQAALFTHLVDESGALVAQDDRLDAPVSSWRSGDIFAQVHRLALQPDAEAGAYRLLAGIYTLPSVTRLRLPTGEDAAPVGEVEVRPSP